MNTVDVTVAVAIAVMGYSIWVRRDTFGSAIERPLSTSVALGMVSFALASPLSSTTVGAVLHTLTGVWHLDTCAGSLCILASQIIAVSWLLGGLFTDEERRAWLSVWVRPVVTVTVPVTAACIIRTRALAGGPANILDATPDAWLTGYFVIWDAATIYIWLAGLRMLHMLRRDQRSRRIADAYIVAMLCGITGCAVQAIRVLTGFEPYGHALISWSLISGAWAGTCLTAAWSWRLKAQRLRGEGPALAA